jgi:2-keto-4-pentenoate hydratase/2-oxohepta-3-ene-1,7-dioic acid hydratase in catechol pathway
VTHRFFAYESAAGPAVAVEAPGRRPADLGALTGERGAFPDLVPAIERGWLGAGRRGELEACLARAGAEAALPERWRWALLVRRPSKILALARNYAAHAAESGAAAPDEPVFFAKLANTLVPHEAPVVIPRWLTSRVDHEVELALIVGRRGSGIAESAAMEHVAGYTILNDVTARALQREDQEARRPWLRSKSMDTFGPIGPYVVPAYAIPDPHALAIALSVNGVERQRSDTGRMVHRIPAVLAAMSRVLTLEPGDVVSTGTPEGVGPVQDGDVMEATIEGLGTLRNPVTRG